MLSEEEFNKLIETARFAPSVHNTQPWKISRQNDGLTIDIDEAHRLGPGDPTGRQTFISLGILAESIAMAAEEIGLKAKKIELKSNKLVFNLEKDKPKGNDIKFIRKRVTDRSVYKSAGVEAAGEMVQKCWQENNPKIWFVKDADFIEKLADFTSKGISLALSNPAFRKELSNYLVLPWVRKKRGISVKSLYLPWPMALLQPALLRFGVNTGQEAKLEKKRWLSASAAILLTTEGDLHEDWFEAGRAYLHISLAIEKCGLSQATSAATVEAATFHEDVEKMLGTNQRLQSVIRIGRGAKRRKYSPRLSIRELIT